MQVKKTINSDIEVTLSMVAKPEELDTIKETVLTKLAPSIKLPGFRGGKAPLALVEKNLDSNMLQNEFLDAALQQFYLNALDAEKLRPVGQPKVELTKFVPFTALEFAITVEVVGDIKLGDYKKLKAEKKKVSIGAKEVNEVVEALRTRAAEKKDVTRASKDGDQVWIDFAGVDAKGKPVAGADGKDYPLALGSNTFIPGFEENVVGLKSGDTKEFTVTFPKDYRVVGLQSKKVTFTVKVTKVQDVVLPKVDDAFAASVGPVKTVDQLKDDIKRELTIEREREAQRDYEAGLVRSITEKSKVAIPESLVAEQTDRLIQETRQNLMYQGQTWEEYLASEGLDEDGYRKKLLPGAEERVKAGLVLSEIAEQESLEITPEEFEARILALKAQYQDEKMQAELEKPEQRRELAARMLTEKTILKLAELNK